ncbi:hypothetical protein DKX15_16105, partial [Enterococcus faecium]
MTREGNVSEARPSSSGDGDFAGLAHARSRVDILAALQTSADGLSSAEAAARLARTGPNRLPAPPHRSPVRLFLAQFNNVL